MTELGAVPEPVRGSMSSPLGIGNEVPRSWVIGKSSQVHHRSHTTESSGNPVIGSQAIRMNCESGIPLSQRILTARDKTCDLTCDSLQGTLDGLVTTC